MLASALISLLIMGRQAQAYFVLGQTPMSTQRIDPIVNPGKEASHVHSFAGVNTVQMTTSLETLEGADCTGSGIQVDKSAYWAPTLYAFDPAKAEFTRLKNTFTNTYYFNRNGKSTKEIEAYPKGIRFLSGNAMATDFDSETVEQITFVCLRGSSPGFESKTLPADFTTCDYGLRLQIHLKTCYDGKPLDMSASDHSAHLAWAGSGNTGDCDPDHPVRLPSQFHEWVYEVNKVAPGSQLVLANGDTVGYTFHVDFISGWDTDVLKKAMNDPSCDEAAFSPAKCAPLSSHIQDDKIKSECPKQVKLSVTEEIDGPLKALPGCNRIFNGPHVGKDKPNACASPVPAGVYAENLYPDPINGGNEHGDRKANLDNDFRQFSSDDGSA
ncbi:hypothetical protein CXG81DRAFT_24215 [Caulochytrium protostelioides]|uniref:DUF1996 domain-containing protein n=1 Tax=Caulochytrium protostelioides TaxID=1555241 RepID=A0A4P9XCD2_9FUNG|nr:hypothetical protein CXG81DRAFT_24215 [Caulochytrium protostelioides]|eukprot:RKP03107.1 hypothetical protein CXG81DRAFT_24215 [Caulochytrium protostelioides]